MNIMQYHHLSLSTKLVVLLLITSTLNSCGEQSRITEKSIHDMMTQIDKASMNKDVDGVLIYISDSARIDLEDAASGKSMFWTKATYKDNLAEGFNLMSNYKSTRTIPEITIDPSGKSAVVKDIITESVTANGKEITTNTVESGTLALENGKLVFTSIKGSFKIK
jgi:hypothetical protein